MRTQEALWTMPTYGSELESAEFVSTGPAVYDRSTTIQHWQLRCLVIASPSTEHELYCAHRNQTICFDLESQTSVVVQDLSFAPTCMAVGEGYIAAGGQLSQLDVRRLDSGENLFKGPLGGSVNNALHIARDASGKPRLFASNNDETVKVFELGSMQQVAAVACHTPINCAAVSPDGQLLCAVGDSAHTFIFQATPTGFRRLMTYSQAKDAGMSCAWNAAGTCFAAASQDGLVCAWDHRSGQVVARLQTRQACRNVQFSRGHVDLLAYAEHESSVHVVDARMYASHQLLRATPPETERHLSGMNFTRSGKKLLVGLENGGIAAFDISTAGRRTFASGQLR